MTPHNKDTFSPPPYGSSGPLNDKGAPNVGQRDRRYGGCWKRRWRDWTAFMTFLASLLSSVCSRWRDPFQDSLGSE
ncbi:hypothetical protein B0H11DRAFT_1831630 [Mycena galericulata]|nr:hypothetical protein B0H11DRAFT_1831630 [Mycena galericulata]